MLVLKSETSVMSVRHAVSSGRPCSCGHWLHNGRTDTSDVLLLSPHFLSSHVDVTAVFFFAERRVWAQVWHCRELYTPSWRRAVNWCVEPFFLYVCDTFSILCIYLSTCTERVGVQVTIWRNFFYFANGFFCFLFSFHFTYFSFRQLCGFSYF